MAGHWSLANKDPCSYRAVWDKRKVPSVSSHEFVDRLYKFEHSTAACKSDLDKLLSGLNNSTDKDSLYNSRRFFDSFGANSEVSGFYEGALAPGSRRECMRVSTVNTRYCALGTIQITQGVCLPESCLSNFRDNHLQLFPEFQGYYDEETYCNLTLSQEMILQKFGGVLPAPPFCDEPASIHGDGWVSVVVFSLIASIVAISSAVVIFKDGANDNMLFSLQSAWKSLTASKRVPKRQQDSVQNNSLVSEEIPLTRAHLTESAPPSNFRSIDAIRVLSMLWIIVGHTFQLFTGKRVAANFVEIREDFPKYLLFYPVSYGTIAVDSFFVIGGFLAFHSLRRLKIETWESCWCVTMIKLWLRRWLRFLPVVCATVLFILLGPSLNGNAGAHQFLKIPWATCQTYPMPMSWIGRVLMIPGGPPGCAGWLWYLDYDILYYLCAAIFWIGVNSQRPWVRKAVWIIYPGIFLVALFSKVLAACVCEFNPASRSYLQDWLPQNGKNVSKMWCEGTLGWFFGQSYFSVHRRLTTYFMGYFAGYYFGHIRNLAVVPQSTIKFYYLRWVAIILSTTAILLMPKYWITHEFGVTSVLYTTFFREAWGLCIIGIVYLLDFVQPSGFNVVAFFIHGSIWEIPSKLNFSAYCVHFQVTSMYVAEYILTGTTITGWTFIMKCMNIAVLSYLLAVVFYMCVEIPFSVLQKKMLPNI